MKTQPVHTTICRSRGVFLFNVFNKPISVTFAHGQPGTPIEANAFHVFAQNTLGALMSLADEAALKRLLFEGHTMVLSQLQEAVANPEAAQTRKLPQVERNAKMITLCAALPGVNIEKQLEPSHSLLDLVSQQFEAQQLAYISPDKCTSREWEVAQWEKPPSKSSLTRTTWWSRRNPILLTKSHQQRCKSMRPCAGVGWPMPLQT